MTTYYRYPASIMLLLLTLITITPATAQNIKLNTFTAPNFKLDLPQECNLIQNHELLQKQKNTVAVATCNDSLVLIQHTPDYHLDKPGKLQKHLDDSENAIKHIPNIRVLNTAIIQKSPPVAIIEIERNDETIQKITQQNTKTLRQTNLIIPQEQNLIQITIFIPDTENAPQTLHNFITTITNSISLKPGKTPLSTLKFALLIGSAIALAGIVIITIRQQRKNRTK